MAKDNPFNIMFGKEPENYINTPMQISHIMDDFQSENPPTQVYTITGVRGSGKTVMMNVIKNLLEEENWITIRLIVNSEESLVKQFAAKLYEIPSMQNHFLHAKLDLSKFGIGISIEGGQPISSIETAIDRMLGVVKDKAKRVLVVIDEVSNTENMRAFASLFQAEVSEEKPLFLLMTGLPQNFYNLSSSPNMTFLKRAPKEVPEKLNYSSIKAIYKKIFDLSDEEAHEMYLLTKGYAYAFQLLGYLRWNSRETDIQSILPEYDQYLSDLVYQPIWEEVSRSQYEEKIIKFIVFSGENEIAKIKEELNIGDNDFNQCKQRLIRKGILEAGEYGKAILRLPRFEEYVRNLFV